MDRETELLPIPYFYVVFTLPAELNDIVLHNSEKLVKLLLSTSTETLKLLALDKKHLGAETGFTSILHTWGSNLMFHPHVHIIVTGGGLTYDGKWQSSRKKFFIPVKVMSKLFRGKFLHALEKVRHEIQGLEDDNVWAHHRKHALCLCRKYQHEFSFSL